MVVFFLIIRRPPRSKRTAQRFPPTTLIRSAASRPPPPHSRAAAAAPCPGISHPMPLDPFVALLVLMAAVMHASWNALVKAGGDKTAMQVQNGRAHVRTPVTNAHLVCRLLL